MRPSMARIWSTQKPLIGAVRDEGDEVIGFVSCDFYRSNVAHDSEANPVQLNHEAPRLH